MKRTKALLSIVLCLLLLWSFFPATALGITTCEDFVDNPTSRSGSGWSWDQTTSTLTLDADGGTINTSFCFPSGATVQVDSDTTVDATEYFTFYSVGHLTFRGDGVLTIVDTELGIATDGDLHIYSDVVLFSGYTGMTVSGALYIQNAQVDVEAILMIGEATLKFGSGYGIVGQYGVVIENSDVSVQGFSVGINAGYSMTPSSLNEMVFSNITIVGSSIDLDMDTSFTVSLEDKNLAAPAPLYGTGLSTVYGNIAIAGNSDIDINGYYDGMVAGTLFAYGYDSLESTLATSVEASGDVTITNSEVDLVGRAFDASNTSAIKTFYGNIEITNSDVSGHDYFFGLNVGFEEWMDILVDYIGLNQLAQWGDVSVTNSQATFSGPIFSQDRSLNGRIQTVGIVVPYGNTSLTDSTVELTQFLKGIMTGSSSEGTLTVDASDVYIALNDMGFGEYDAVAAFWPYQSSMSLTEVGSLITLADCYIYIPEEGMVETWLPLMPTQLQGIGQMFDYIAPDESGVVHIKTYPTVTFNSKGGSAVPSQVVAPGTTATKPADPTKSGFIFDGWFLDEAATQAVDFAAFITEDVTFYAKWTQEQTIQFVETDAATGVKATGLEENLNIPETSDPDIIDIVVFVKAQEKTLDSAIKTSVETQLAGKGYTLLGVYNIELFKRTTNVLDQTVETKIGNEDIEGPVTVYLPITAQQALEGNLAIAYIATDGTVTIIQGQVVTIGDQSYFTFATDHFSDYALVEMTQEPNPPTGAKAEGNGPTTNTPWVMVLIPVLLSGILVVLKKKKATA